MSNKKVILVSQEGRPIYDGDHIFEVNKDFEIDKWFVREGFWSKEDCLKLQKKFYKDKKIAEAYIHNNKPVYSVFQLQKTLDSFNIPFHYSTAILKYMEEEVRNG